MTEESFDDEYKTGEQLLQEWGCSTREERLHRAVLALEEQIQEYHEKPVVTFPMESRVQALMEQLERIHVDQQRQSLSANLLNEEICCSCADAYRMGHASLRPAS